MNRRGDIDGILEGWFLDGPMQMPDRLFDAVFEQVERVPQRRLARLQLRFTDMSPTARLLVAAGATILVLGVGAAAIGAIRSTPSTSPDVPSPSATPASSTDAAVPASLQHPFLGPLRTEAPAPTAQDRSILRFDDAGFTYNANLLRSSAVTVGPTRLRLVAETVAGGCAVGDEALYDWSSSAGETKVTFTLVSDACEARAAVVPGEWVRSDCPDDANDCIGPLEADTYSSLFIDPWVAAGEPWQARYGAMTYTVPAGWENPADWPTEYRLQPQGAEDGTTGIFIASEVWPIMQDDPCTFSPDRAVERTPSGMVAYLESLPGLAPVQAEPVTIGGLSGYRIDLTMGGTWTSTCPWSQGERVRPLYGDGDSADGFAWNVGPNAPIRNWFLDLGRGRSLWIDVEGPDAATYNGLIDEATAIVESMVFTPPE